MKFLRIITQREYLNKIRNKSFIIMTFVSPLIMVAFILLIGWLVNINKSEVKNIAIIDESHIFATAFTNTDEVHYHYLQNTDLLTAKKEVLEKGNYGLLYIPPKNTPNWYQQISFYTEETPALSLTNAMLSVLEKTLFQYNLTEKNINQQEIESAKVRVSLQLQNFTGEKTSEWATLVKSILGMSAGYLIFMFIIMYGNMIMRSVIEEKNNRIIEIIISSVKPFDLMLGKILGTSLAGITQAFIWIVFTGVLFALLPTFFDMPMTGTTTEALQSPDTAKIQEVLTAIYQFPLLETFVLFILFFVGGYLLYSSLYAMIGAMVDNETDTQQFLLPVITPLMLAVYVGMFSVMEQTHGTVSVVFSYIPFTSPVVMLMRIPFGVAWWEILISLLILYLTFFMVIKLSAKIYRIGILMYGKKASYKEVWKWLKTN
ncbi:ABC-2 type transporter [Capnocytophaga sp. oral taxon 332 str. F0381]|uniref:ABC transporter permease n=1 Tax=Capnocytophaga sp. oral taxon 332 TaxID=712213 RepID=UPI0002A2A5BE|nr:ABC transporter permease [Capnocytophaga sp. oral taxon 332]EKY10567.1 ABC-2 type transporter [Capnocytophaga sp. oral taxon 332 str. F0381]